MAEVPDIPNAPAPRALTGLTQDEFVDALRESGHPKYRADQVLDWVYRKGATSYDAMTNLGEALRGSLATTFPVSDLSFVRNTGSADTTRKFLFRLRDGRYVETVLIPASPSLYGSRSDRRTACVSSQVGCAYGCVFCASGLAGFARNLDASEIVGQVHQLVHRTGERVDNIVFMGMGEPLANLTNLTRAIEIFNAHWGMGIGARQMTVSTSGLAPQIKKLAEIPFQIRLAISLHGATDEVRDRIMPVNRKYPLDVLFDSLHHWREKRKQRITFEYILIDGVNDSPDDAAHLARRAKSVGAKVNLIPYNTVEGLAWKRPPEHRQNAFHSALTTQGVIATLRREKGHDIDAACGQLRLKEEALEA